MSWRRWVTGVLVVALVSFRLVAHASPLDPTWIGGFWDDGDHDDVMLRVILMANATDTNLVVPPSPAPVVSLVATLETESFTARTFSPTASRAPPVLA
jgi:hypothetical protein